MSVGQAFQELEDFGVVGGLDIAFGAASVRGAALPTGRYQMIATQDCFVQRGTAGAALATGAAPDHYLKANMPLSFLVLTDDTGVRDAVAAIRDTADGILRIRKVSRK